MGRITKIIWCAALALSILAVTGCKPEGVIPPKDLSSIFAEFYLADATIEVVQESGSKTMPFDSLRVYRPILEARGYTDEDFRTSLNYYLHDPKTLMKICENARDELLKRADMAANERIVDDVDHEEEQQLDERPAPEKRVPQAVQEGTEPELEKRDATPDTGDKPARKAPQRKKRQKMTRQELKQLEKELQ
jgi:hypothetical protein